MAKQDRAQKSAFVIKLSTETLQKLEEEEQSNSKNQEISPSKPEKPKDITKDVSQKDQIVLGDGHEKNDDCVNNKNESVDQKESDNIVSNEVLDNESNNCKTTSVDDTINKHWGEYAAFVTYEGDQAIYTDPSTQQKYSWNISTTCWDPLLSDKDKVYSYENDTHVYTEADGSKFFWDAEKNAWIPKVDDDFLAMYQMSYGFIDNTKKDDDEKDSSKTKESMKTSDVTGIKRKNEPQWFEAAKETNTKVYVSNLPLDLTEEEFVNFMQKCGLVERDPSSQKMKIKLYVDKEQNCFKGDALCTYIKIESVDLALKILDGSDFKGNKIKVERAHFQLKGEYNAALKPKKKKKKEIEKIKKMQQKLFDWRPEKFIGERSKHERVVIVKNLFQPSDFDKDVQLILDYQQDLREESTKCGEVRKVVIYDRHPDGVAQITMKEPEQADAVVQLISGRWFGKRQITAEIWDGRTKYRIAETDAEISKRINKWDKFLEGEEDKNKQSKKNDADSQEIKKDKSVESDKSTDEDKEKICSDTPTKECDKSDTNLVQCKTSESNV